MRKYNICVKTAIAVFAGLLSACSSDNDIVEDDLINPEKPVSQEMTFHAGMDAGNTTRTTFNSNNTIWAAGDAISVYNTASVDDGSNKEYSGDFGINDEVDEGEDDYTYSKEADFKGTAIKANGKGNDQFYAFYPADNGEFVPTEDGIKREAVLGNIQKAEKDTYDQSLHLMSAYSTNSSFAFNNVCALLKIKIKSAGSARPITRVKLVANPTLANMDAQKFTYTYIAGTFDANIDAYGKASVTPKNREDDETKPDTRKTYVELRVNGKDGNLSTVIPDGTYYMVVLPGTLSNGFTLLFETTSGTIYQRINPNSKKFVQNNIYSLGEYDFASGIPSNVTAFKAAEVVDLDLPSGTLWCKKNLNNENQGSIIFPKWVITGFVESESDYGASVSFGYESTKTSMGDVPSDRMTNNTLKGTYDAAYNYSGFNKKYCMPVYAQIFEFYNHFSVAYKESFTSSAPYGARFTASTGTGRSLWLPYAGSYWGGNNGGMGTQARYWSRTHTTETGTYADAYDLDLEEGTVDSKKVPVLDDHGGFLEGGSEWEDDSYVGRSIRPVVVNEQIAKIMK